MQRFVRLVHSHCSAHLTFFFPVAIVVFLHSPPCGRQGFESRQSRSILGFFSAIAKIVARLRGSWLYFISIRWANEIYFITTYTRRYDVTSLMPEKAYLRKRIRLRI